MTDHDIFVRELVSNGCDAITKLKKLEVMGEYTFPEGYKPEIQVIVNPDEKTLKFIDNGIGMTADEVEKYITQIAFSGATQFLEKYKDKTTEDDMIGHFGLGFYSAFMVADEVHRLLFRIDNDFNLWLITLREFILAHHIQLFQLGDRITSVGHQLTDKNIMIRINPFLNNRENIFAVD